jgi:rhodanese-related sulfurtransferase
LGITLLSHWRGIDCGCFGSLPFFSQFSFNAHLLLLGGMFLGLYYLTTPSKAEKATPQAKDSQTATISEMSSWAGLAGVVMMLSAFLTLPFTSSDSRASNDSFNNTVDRADVEAAIANHSAVIIDARPDFQYELGHLTNAINIPYDSNNLVELVNAHSLKNQALIVYCSSVHCNAAEVLAEKLRELGCKKVSLYPGGWEEWVSGRDGDEVK